MDKALNIEKDLLKPRHLQKEQAEQIALTAAGAHKAFTQLLAGLRSENVTLSKRAAWCFSLAAKLKPEWTDSCQADLVELLKLENAHDGLLRNTLRILRDCKIHPDLYDQLAYYCFEFAQDTKRSIAIRAFSMHILGQIGLAIPDIQPEVNAIIEYHFEEGTPGLISSAKSVRRLWAKNDSNRRTRKSSH